MEVEVEVNGDIQSRDITSSILYAAIIYSGLFIRGAQVIYSVSRGYFSN